MNFADVLERLISGDSLSEEQAGQAISAVMSGEYTEPQTASLLTALRCKGETVDEVVGAARAMRTHAETIPGHFQGVLDTCGTGGDGHGSFNISTTAAFVVAAAGVPVAKHGNRSATSRCGSIDLFERLGVNVMMTPAQMARCLSEAGMTVLFARVVHPAMKYAAPVRSTLRFRTIFNYLGPLTNPLRPSYQLIGISDRRFLEMYAACLQKLGVESAWVVHGSDGMDEITLSGPTTVVEVTPKGLNTFEFTPEEAGLRRYPLEALKGGEVEQNAEITLSILRGGGEAACRDAVLLNAAAGLKVAGKAGSISEGVALATESLASGKALQLLERLKQLSNQPIA